MSTVQGNDGGEGQSSTDVQPAYNPSATQHIPIPTAPSAPITQSIYPSVPPPQMTVYSKQQQHAPQTYQQQQQYQAPQQHQLRHRQVGNQQMIQPPQQMLQPQIMMQPQMPQIRTMATIPQGNYPQMTICPNCHTV